MNLSSNNLRPSARLERETGRVRMSFSVPEDFFFCRGHFENDPLVPGAVIAAWMLEAAKLAGGGEAGHLSQLKFRSAIVPGDAVTVTAEVDEAGRTRARVSSGERLCADVVFSS